ncbi:probable serine/threonine-protein kinase DDB_G0277449 isoform X2 [Xenopus laevis]|uniref:non-specific serine/threonine protein kinase n=1 Tax=Xenopus laevis TaxID=8355 RepID=A0A8J0TQH0_XENLA|nr:probable serine/threonine-protein kinase DDB_G0277449 isoform X2 [Xenopus laevis]
MLKTIRNCCGALCSLFHRKKKKEPINSEQILPEPQVKTPEAGKKKKKKNKKKTQEIVKPPVPASQVKTPEAGKKKKKKKTQEIVKPPVPASQVKNPKAGKKKKTQEIVKPPFPASKVKTPKEGKKKTTQEIVKPPVPASQVKTPEEGEKEKTQVIVKPVFPAPQVKTPEAEDEIKTQVIVEPLETVEQNVLSSEVDAADEEVSGTFERKSKNLSETTTTLKTIRDCCGALCSLCHCEKKKEPIDCNLPALNTTSTKEDLQVTSVFQERPDSTHQNSLNTISDFKFNEFLGRGSFGQVFKAEHKKTGKILAIKKLNKEKYFALNMVKSVFVERDVLRLARNTRCPFLVSLFCSFQTEHHAFLAMEFAAGGSLGSLLKTGALTQESTLFYAACITSGIKFIHVRGIIHRDIKPDNVVIDSTGYAQLADFGLCKTGVDHTSKIEEPCGDPSYNAPEILRGERYKRNVDWWSLGITIYEMAVAKLPFTGQNQDEMINNIFYTEPDYPSDLDSGTISIIEALVDKDPRFRLGSAIDDGEEVQRFRYFKSIDWNALWNKQLKAPFIPSQRTKTDGNEDGIKFTDYRWRLDQDVHETFRNFEELPEEYS